MNPGVSRNGRRLLIAFFGLLAAFLYAPILVLIVFSFNDREFVSFPWEGFTLRWYEAFVRSPSLLAALRASAQVAAVTSVTAVALAVPVAIVLVRKRFTGKSIVSALVLSPLVIPYVVFGISLLILFNALGDLIGVQLLSIWTIAIGHVVISLPFAVLTLVPRLERISVSLEEAARDLGAGGLRTFRTVTLPLMMPAVVSALLIVFTLSFDEVVVASFIAGERPTFPVYLLSQLRLPRQLPPVIAVAVVVMAMSAVVVLVAEVGRAISDRRLAAEPVETEV